MSIGILIGVHDGLVMAADSASTLTISAAPGAAAGVANVYDNANKIFNLYKGKPIGCVTFGAGSIGSSSIGTLIKDLRASLMGSTRGANLGLDFDPDNYTMELIAKMVSQFLTAECQKQEPVARLGMDMGLLIGGYSTNESLGESWSLEIKAGVAQEPKRLRAQNEAGISWGGSGEAIQRLIFGFSPSIFQVLAEVTQPTGSAEQIAQQLSALFVSKMQANFVFAPMPIQDAIDLSRFLVYTAEMYSRFLPGAQIVGGPIEIAAITKYEGFKWISRKHYYDQSLNKEPLHVIED